VPDIIKNIVARMLGKVNSVQVNSNWVPGLLALRRNLNNINGLSLNLRVLGLS